MGFNLKLGALLALTSAIGLSKAEEVGYFADSSVCADPSGLATCYEDAQSSYTSCISNNCAGGSSSCVKSCNGDANCIAKKCPNLGIDCINACGCVRAEDQISCTASSCWNQVYSCQYQLIVEDLLNLCVKQHLDDIPFWPPPDKAPGGCSCNIGKADKKELQIGSYLTECANNMTNLNQMSDVDEMTDYAQACICCQQSAIMSTIYDTCPNTKPSVIGADDWFAALFANSKWENCGKYLEAYDCAGDLGYGAKEAGDTHNFYKPGGFPKNGTETLYNTGGVISTPISGASFTWTYGPIKHPVTVKSTDNVVTATATATGKSDDPSTTASGTAASSTKTDIAVSARTPYWGPAVMLGALGLAFA